MSRRDYVAMAQALAALTYVPEDDPEWDGEWGERPEWHEGYETCRGDAARALADVLATDNPRFDSGRFLAACKVS